MQLQPNQVLNGEHEMADFPDENLNQTAVYWGNPQPDGTGGFTYDDPVEVDCRWVSSIEVITAANGDQIVCRARVQVGQDLDEQGKLYLGELDDLDSSEEADPTIVDGAYIIKRFDKIPTIRGDKFYRKAYL